MRITCRTERVQCSGKALIRHAETEVTYEVQSDELKWSRGIYHVRSKGNEWLYVATIQHPQLGELRWELWEYPVGKPSHRETFAGPHTVVRNFDYALSAVEHDLDAREVDRAIEQVLNELPDQEAGVTFGISPAGTIGIDWTPPDGSASSQIDGLLPELRHASETLRWLLEGSNAYGVLSEVLQRYWMAAQCNPLSIDQLYSTGVRLENARLQTKHSIHDGELPSLPQPAAEALDSVLALHGVIVGSTVRGRELMDGAQA